MAASLGFAASAEAVQGCYFQSVGSCTATNNGWLAASGGASGWWPASGSTQQSNKEYMANYTGSGSPRMMRIAMMNCSTSCTVYDVQTAAPTLSTLIYEDVRRNRRRLCQNVGGSGGYFQCGWFN